MDTDQDVDVDRDYELRLKASMPASYKHLQYTNLVKLFIQTFISTSIWSSSYMMVIGSRSMSQKQKAYSGSFSLLLHLQSIFIKFL